MIISTNENCVRRRLSINDVALLNRHPGDRYIRREHNPLVQGFYSYRARSPRPMGFSSTAKHPRFKRFPRPERQWLAHCCIPFFLYASNTLASAVRLSFCRRVATSESWLLNTGRLLPTRLTKRSLSLCKLKIADVCHRPTQDNGGQIISDRDHCQLFFCKKSQTNLSRISERFTGRFRNSRSSSNHDAYGVPVVDRSRTEPCTGVLVRPE